MRNGFSSGVNGVGQVSRLDRGGKTKRLSIQR